MTKKKHTRKLGKWWKENDGKCWDGELLPERKKLAGRCHWPLQLVRLHFTQVFKLNIKRFRVCIRI